MARLLGYARIGHDQSYVEPQALCKDGLVQIQLWLNARYPSLDLNPMGSPEPACAVRSELLETWKLEGTACLPTIIWWMQRWWIYNIYIYIFIFVYIYIHIFVHIFIDLFIDLFISFFVYLFFLFVIYLYFLFAYICYIEMNVCIHMHVYM